MIVGPVPNRAAIQQAVGDFLTSILPPGMPIVLGQQNRVPEPLAEDFAIFTEMFQIRLGTNEDAYADAYFTGSVAGSTLTVSSVQYGEISVGATLFGPTVQPSTTILSGGTGTGGVGTYALSARQIVSPGPLAAGSETLQQATEITFQVDVHGPHSADNAQMISTLWRDGRGVAFFYELYPGMMAPLYADDPRQIPFHNDQDQVEYRWVIDAKLQVNPVITAPQQFADQLVPTLQDVQ